MQLSKMICRYKVYWVIGVFAFFSYSLSLVGLSCGPQHRRYDGPFVLRVDGIDHEMSIEPSSHPIAMCSEDYISQRRKDVSLSTADGVKIPVDFVDNNSSRVLVLGQGFGGAKESMSCFVRAFGAEYDIVTFNYRWTSRTYKYSPKTLLNPIKRLFYDAVYDVFAVVDFVHSLKRSYKEIICLGECYSAFLFVLAQAYAGILGKKLFTRMVLDSCWVSFDAFTESLSLDPSGYSYPQGRKCPWCVKTSLSVSIVHKLFTSFLGSFAPYVSIEEFLQTLYSAPILFIHGANDPMVLHHHFEQLWSLASSTKRAVLFTPYGHVDNFHKKYLYKNLVDAFVHNSFDDFVHLIKAKKLCV